MSDFHVLMVLYKEGFGDVGRVLIPMDMVRVFQKYLESCLHSDGKYPLSPKEYRNVCRIDDFLYECIRTEEEQNRLEKK